MRGRESTSGRRKSEEKEGLQQDPEEGDTSERKYEFFSDKEKYIIKKGLETLSEKLQELKEKDELPTHFILLDTSARVFQPAVNELISKVYEDSQKRKPPRSFLVPDVSEDEKLNIKDRIEGITKKNRTETNTPRIMMIDDYVESGSTMKKMIKATEDMDIEADFFSFFYSTSDSGGQKKTVEEELGSNFFYGATEDTPIPDSIQNWSDTIDHHTNYDFHYGLVTPLDDNSKDREYHSKTDLTGVAKDKHDPDKYAEKVEEASQNLIRGIRKESKRIGKEVAEKLSDEGEI
ncbi:MAG: hypothetical protein ABEJ24_04005 [Candidatus Magasanikbacteria bacterium]